MAINTYWDITLGVILRKGNITKDCVKDFELQSDADPILSFTWNTTIITITISLFLVAAALVALVLGVFTKAPDTLGYVSTAARDNPDVTTRVPSHLDGLEAARVLRDVQIRTGDVNSTAEFGHVAFASMDMEPGKVSGKVSRKRLYD